MAGHGRRAVAAELAVELAVAGERFARWRRGRIRGARIPRELWQLAIGVGGPLRPELPGEGDSGRLLRFVEAMPLVPCMCSLVPAGALVFGVRSVVTGVMVTRPGVPPPASGSQLPWP